MTSKTHTSTVPHKESPTQLEFGDPDARRIYAALQGSKIGVFEFNPINNKIYWDHRVRAIWGLGDTEEISRELIAKQLHPDDAELHDTISRRAVDPAGDGVLDMEFRIFPRGGRPMRWIHARGQSIFIDGKIVQLLGTVEDITERREYLERNKLLTHELQHRVKNTFATMLSVINLSKVGHDTVEDYAASLQDRLLSMAETQNILRRNDWNMVAVSDILKTEFNAFVDSRTERLKLSGGELHIPAHRLKILAMAIHELITNALKHGSLRGKDGYVDVYMYQEKNMATFRWKEIGGAPVKANDSPSGGFGSFLLDQVVSAELSGTTNHKIMEDGAYFALEFPLEAEE